jgi:hypothetical protein
VAIGAALSTVKCLSKSFSHQAPYPGFLYWCANEQLGYGND